MWGRQKRVGVVLALIFGASTAVANGPPPMGPVCPGTYAGWTGVPPLFCRAALPSSEFYYGGTPTAPPTPGGPYPMCGDGRIPVTGDGNYTWMNVSSSAEPKSNQTHCYCGGGDCSAGGSSSCPASETGIAYPHSYVPVGGTVVGNLTYLYSGVTRCACIGRTISATPLSGTPTPGPLSPTLPNGKPRMYPDTADVIGSQDNGAGANYGMVAIAYDGTSDGRNGDLYHAGNSFCGCPNVNEKMVQIDPSSPTSGVQCVPEFSDPHRILATFDPSIYDTTTDSQVIDRTFAGINPSTDKVVSTIVLPASLTNQTATQIYQRKIWACLPPYTLNTSSKTCEFKRERHACNAGNGAGIAPSEVSPSITGSSKAEKFENAMNKKLACCLNEFGSTGTSVKFDCVDNTQTHYADFNTIWGSGDPSVDGAQSNAIVLANSMGKLLSGFYTLAGNRCQEYSEFGGLITPGKVNPAVVTAGEMNLAKQAGVAPANAFQANPTQPLIHGESHGDLSTYFASKGIPQTAAEKRRCPILVRAAIVAKCPTNPLPPAAQKTITLPDGSTHCSAASSLQVEIRIEQVYEVAGMPKMIPEDTILDPKNASAISIDRLIANKYGNQCPPGTSRVGDACVY